jgi:hypothetical protein
MTVGTDSPWVRSVVWVIYTDVSHLTTIAAPRPWGSAELRRSGDERSMLRWDETGDRLPDGRGILDESLHVHAQHVAGGAVEYGGAGITCG